MHLFYYFDVTKLQKYLTKLKCGQRKSLGRNGSYRPGETLAMQYFQEKYSNEAFGGSTDKKDDMVAYGDTKEIAKLLRQENNDATRISQGP